MWVVVFAIYCVRLYGLFFVRFGGVCVCRCALFPRACVLFVTYCCDVVWFGLCACVVVVCGVLNVFVCVCELLCGGVWCWCLCVCFVCLRAMLNMWLCVLFVI